MASRMGPGPWLHELAHMGISLPGGINPKARTRHRKAWRLHRQDVDYFHAPRCEAVPFSARFEESIAHQEIARLGLPGFIDSLGAGYLISAPAIHHFGTEEMRRTLFPQLLRGEKWSALAISEPFAGSDVAQIKATATRSPDGKHFIVNGVKKWITEGAYADYFVTAVRTGGPGGKGGVTARD